jgi:hypothetical protein
MDELINAFFKQALMYTGGAMFLGAIYMFISASKLPGEWPAWLTKPPQILGTIALGSGVYHLFFFLTRGSKGVAAFVALATVLGPALWILRGFSTSSDLFQIGPKKPVRPPQIPAVIASGLAQLPFVFVVRALLTGGILLGAATLVVKLFFH